MPFYFFIFFSTTEIAVFLNRNKELDKFEFYDALETLDFTTGIPKTAQKLLSDLLFSIFDLNGDGKVDIKEFGATMAVFSSKDPKGMI